MMYYLTKATVMGDKALKACASGYHMASVAELSDPNTLQYYYNPEIAIIFPRAVSGSDWPDTDQIHGGRALRIVGWISQSYHQPDCHGWTSADRSLTGTVASFYSRGADPPLPGYPNLLLYTIERLCESELNVWCMQDH
jgi:hypothetical protein